MLKLIDVCNIISRGRTIPEANKSENGDIYNVRLINITVDGNIILDDNYKYNVENKTSFLYLYGVRTNDIIFPELTREKLDVRIIKGIESNIATYSSRIIFARVNPELYNSMFLARLLNSDKYKRKLLENAYKKSIGYSYVSQIRMEELRNFEIPNISLEEQERIVKEDTKIRKRINDNIIKLKGDLARLYDL